MSMFDRFRTRKTFNYSRWDGTQRLDDLDAKSILDALSDDYLKHGDLRRALERMMQQGFTGQDGQQRMGLQDLMQRLRQQRQQRQQRYNMSGVMDEIKEKLEHIKQLEREGIQHRLDSQQPNGGQQSADGQSGDQGEQQSSQASGEQQGEGQQAGQSPQTGQQGQQGQRGQRGQQGSQAGQSGQQGQAGESGVPEGMDPDMLRRMLENIANRKLQFLDQLPKDPAGQIKQLTDYDFMDEQAREEFQELLQQMQQQVMSQYFQGMQQALQNMS
ncbi:MAG: VWA domain-containing protein, partial [Ktedonobacterales bacterium]